VASSINLIIAQRLVRTLCEKCRFSTEINPDVLRQVKMKDKAIDKFFKGKNKITVFQGRGCSACGRTGFSGRTGIFEIMVMTDNIKSLVMDKANAEEIQEKAIKDGMASMFDDGVEKVLTGQTTINELMRVSAVN
jgi:type II secretory ATPase GspE/PulE/Tfp pilus assembly ATPase PilB-like protein